MVPKDNPKSKLNRLIILALIGLGLLTACGSQPTPAPTPVAIEPPTISDPKISAPTPQEPGQEVGISVDVSSASGASLTYAWRVDGGEIIRGDGSPAITYRTPDEPGIYNVRVAVMWDDSSVEKITTIRVEAPEQVDTPTPEPPADTPTPEAMQAPPTATVPPPTSTLEPTPTLAPAAAAPTNTPEPPPSVPESTFKRAKRTGVIRVGFAQEHPYGFANSDGSLSGESIEIARLIFDRLGIPELEGVVTTFESLIPELQANRFDVITAGMWIHPERCEQVLFADPQYKSIVEDRPGPMYGAIAFRKEDADLRDAFNVELQKLKASGELEAILTQFDGYVGETSLPGNVTAAEICNPSAFAGSETTASPQITSERGDLILNRGTIAIGIRQDDMYPVTFEDNGDYRGFEIELAKEIVQRLFGNAVTIEWVPLASAERLEAVRANRIDFLIRNTTHTRFRENMVAFTSNYFWDGIRLLVRRGGGYTGIESMAGKTIVVPDFTTTSGDPAEAVVRRAAAAAGVNVTVLVDDDAYTVFNEGRADATATDWMSHSFLSSNYAAHQAIGDLLSSEPIAIAVSLNDPAFRDEVDAALREIIADGTWRTIYDRWFPEPPPWTIDEMLAAPPTAGG